MINDFNDSLCYQNAINSENSKRKNDYLSRLAREYFPDIIKKFSKQRSYEMHMIAVRRAQKKFREDPTKYEKQKINVKAWRSKQRNSRKAKNIKYILDKALPNIETGMLEGKYKIYTNKNGYQFTIFLGTTYYIHRLIWMKANNRFIPEGFEINHKNLDKKDNRIKNLELITHKENIQHFVDNNFDIIERRKKVLALSHLPVFEIAKKLNIDYGAVYNDLKILKIKPIKSFRRNLKRK